MNTALICNLCKRYCMTNRTTFSCNHTICSLCMNRLLIMNEFSGLNNLREVKIDCNCLYGEYKFPLSELNNLLTSGVVVQKEGHCDIHKDDIAKYYCPICLIWLCPQCYNKHTETYSQHQTSSFRIDEINKCVIHESDTSHYCKQCKKELCAQCIKDSKHKDHVIYTFNDYFAKKTKRRTLRNGYASYTLFETKIDEILNQYRQFHEKEVKEKEDLIKSLLDQLAQLAQNYKEEMETNKEKICSMLETMKHMYKVYYNNIYSVDQSVYYYKLSKGYKKDFNDIIFLQDNNEELKTIQEMIIKYSSRNHLNYKFIFNHFSFNSVFVLKGHTEAVLSLAYVKQGSVLASASQDHYVRLWDLDTYNCFAVLEGHSDEVYTVYGNNDLLLSGSRDDRIIQWDLDTKKIKTFSNGHSIHVYSIIRLSNGNLASGSRDESIKLWECKNTKITCIKALKGHENTILSLIELVPGQLVSGSADSKIKIWDLAKSKCIHTIDEHNDSVNCLAKLADGNFASCSSDKTIKLFNGLSYKSIYSLTGHTESIYCLIQLSDSRLASGSCDFSIMLWDIYDKTCTQILKGHRNTVFSLIQLRDGRMVSSSGDNTIRIWD